MNIGIFDDDISIAEDIKSKILQLPDNAGYCIDSVECFEKPPEESQKEYEVVFMDIDWHQEVNGIDFANKLCERYPATQIVFVTGYNDRYSQDIFLSNANLCGYLVKPVDNKRLERLLRKASEQRKAAKKTCLSKEIAIQTGDSIELVNTNSITYVESNAHKIIIHLINHSNESISLYAKLDDYAANLREGFIRIHKSYLVNALHIKKLGYSSVILKNEIELPISKRNAVIVKEEFFKYMKDRTN